MRSLLGGRALFRLGPSLVTGLTLLLSTSPARGAWPTLGGSGATVCDAPGVPNQLSSAPDGQGGAFFAWIDGRAGNPNPRLYAQHFDAAGTPLWTADGLLLNSSKVLEPPRLVSDGEGGAIIVWRDFRADTAGNVYAQHLNSAGGRLWDASDVPVAAGPNHENFILVAPDGGGGALVTWSDDRTGFSDIRVQRVTASGALDWGADGVSMGAPQTTSNPLHPLVCSDGAGGALVGYTAFVSPSFNALIQRLSPAGVPLWTQGGVKASSSTLGVNCVGLAPDGTGGALVALRDNRSQNSWQQAFAQRIAADGSVAWDADGVSLSGSAYPVEEQAVVADGTGGGYFEWRSYLNDGTGANHLSVQRLSAAGLSQWSAAVQVVAAPVDGNGWLHSQMIPDGAGGVLVAWNAQGTSGGFDVSAQRLTADGTRDWSPGPRVLASLTHTVWQLGLVPDGTGGAIASWVDTQDFTTPFTLGAERVLATGTLDVRGTVSAFRGVGCSPTPARAGDKIKLRFVLAQQGAAIVRVLDVSGRLVRTLPVLSHSSGEQAVTWDALDDGGRRVRPGLYLVRVDAAGMLMNGRAVVAQ